MKRILIVAMGMALAASPAQAWVITATGTIYSDGPYGTPDQTGLFGTPGLSLVGYAYTQTITTDPLLNTFFTESIPYYHQSYGGAGIGGCCGAPYTITTTVNGVTYTQTESNPYINRSYLIDGLSTGLYPADQVFQEVDSSGCSSGYGPCTSSYILAYSFQTAFVPSLDFEQSLIASSELDPASNTYFLFRNGPTQQGSVNQYTVFYGSISTISIDPVPEPSTLVVLASGLGVMGWFAWRKKQDKAARLT
jgi:PEP-CTERM motif